VGKEKAFLGGAILPGAAMMAEALNEKTSRLPKIDLVPPSSVIGKDTANNIRSGIFIGTAGAVERVVDEIERDFGYTIKVILTGGLCEVFWSFIRNVDIVDPMLTLKGLFAIYERIIRKSS
jgi:type III pantothenate kinase